MTAFKMKHVQTTVRKLITWAQVHDLAFRPHCKPDWNVSLTLVVDSPLIRIFAILMKVNWQPSNYSIRWPESPGCIAGSFFYPLRSRIFLTFFADILFDQGLNSVFWAEPQSSENLSILENLANMCLYTNRPTFLPSAPQAYQCLISHFLAS